MEEFRKDLRKARKKISKEVKKLVDKYDLKNVHIWTDIEKLNTPRRGIVNNIDVELEVHFSDSGYVRYDKNE